MVSHTEEAYNLTEALHERMSEMHSSARRALLVHVDACLTADRDPEWAGEQLFSVATEQLMNDSTRGKCKAEEMARG